MASKVQIWNLALTKLGAARVSDPADTGKSATTLAAIYDSAVDAELASHPWTFAKARAQLPASSTAPSFGWAYAYPLPAGFLKLIEVGENWVFYTSDTGALFELEGANILTDQSAPLNIRYVQRIENTGLFSALFVEALASRLAYTACEAITQSLSKREQAMAEYKEAVRLARRSNDIELPPQQAAPNSWERAMLGLGG